MYVMSDKLNGSPLCPLGPLGQIPATPKAQFLEFQKKKITVFFLKSAPGAFEIDI